MLKRILILLALAGTPLWAAPLDEQVPAGDADYVAMRSMRDRFGGNALPKEPGSRGEVVLALAELTADANSRVPQGAWKQDDYDSLYSLLQKYRDELRAMGFSQKQLEDEMAALKVRAHELKERLDKLQPKDGMKIHGRITNIYDEMMLTGPGKNSGDPFRYRHGMVRAELSLSVVRGIFSGELEYFLQRVLSDMYSCTTCDAMVNRINVEVRTPIAFQVGDLDVQTTPLTIWRNEDEEPFEPEPFRSRRISLLNQMRLKTDSLRLRGSRISTKLVLFDSLKLPLEGMLFNLGLSGQPVYKRGSVATLTGDSPGALPAGGPTYTSLYTSYFGAWRLRVPVSFFEAAYTGTIIKDATDTATIVWAGGPLNGQRVRGFDSQVHSVEAGLKFEDLGLALKGEYAQSLYSNPNTHPAYASDYLTGTAMILRAGFQGARFGVSVTARDVSDTFVSTPAQGRTVDAEYLQLGPFLTENSLFHPNTTGVGPQFGGILPGNQEPPESPLNAQILPPQVNAGGTFVSGFMIPFDWRVNALSPYGLATPNRSGARLDLRAGMLSGGLKFKGSVDVASEKVKQGRYEPIAFSTYRAGLAVDLEPWFEWPLSFSGGYTMGDARNSGKVAFSTALIDVGIEWVASKRLRLHAGGRHLDFNGSLPYLGTADAQLAAWGYVAVRQVYDLGGVGMVWDLGDDVIVRVNYSTLLFDDLVARSLGKSPQWEMDQGYMELGFVF